MREGREISSGVKSNTTLYLNTFVRLFDRRLWELEELDTVVSGSWDKNLVNGVECKGHDLLSAEHTITSKWRYKSKTCSIYICKFISTKIFLNLFDEKLIKFYILYSSVLGLIYCYLLLLPTIISSCVSHQE